MTEPKAIRMRSWLFAPGDSERKMEKAAAGPADQVIFDLEDAVTEDNKPAARETVAQWLAANPDARDRIWIRVNPLDGPHTLADLAAVMHILHPGCLPRCFSGELGPDFLFSAGHKNRAAAR